MLDSCGSIHPLIESYVSYGRVVSHSCCLFTPIIFIFFDDGTSCARVMCVACTTHVIVTAANFPVSIMCGSVYCCLYGDIIAHRVINSLIPQGSNSHGDIL